MQTTGKDPSAQDPSAQLSQETEAARALLALLKQEQALLIEADADKLPGLLEQKSALVARIADMAGARHRALAEIGFAPNEAGMQSWLDSRRTSSEQSWNDLIALARSAKEANRINGLLINRQMRNNQHAINILQGTAQGGGIYGPNGQSAVGTVSRRRIIG